MTIGLITITHNRIGEEILTTARQIVGEPPLACRHFDVCASSDPARVRRALETAMGAIDSGDGVLILADLYGATPCNVARGLHCGHAVRVVSGINLPMVLRVLNYAHFDLAAVAELAAVGGQRGIIDDSTDRVN